MGGGRIFLKNLRDTSFNKDLSNEPTFGRIHLVGQYLKYIIKYRWIYQNNERVYKLPCSKILLGHINSGVP